MGQLVVVVVVVVVLCVQVAAAAAQAAGASEAPSPAPAAEASCPLDLRYVTSFPWDSSSCLPDSNRSACCETLLFLLGVALSRRVKDTGHFRLPDLPTSAACLAAYQSNLTAFSPSLPTSLVSSCFTPSRFVINPNTCAGIQTTQDWERLLGNSTELDGSCSPDLSVLTRCQACLYAGLRVASRLTAIDGNNTHTPDCFIFTSTYAAAVVNRYGPEHPSTANCILGLPLSSGSSPQPPPTPAPAGGKRRSGVGLLFGLTGAAVAVAVLSAAAVAAYLCWFRKGPLAVTSVAVFGRIILGSNDKTTAFPSTSVDGLDYINEFLLIF